MTVSCKDLKERGDWWEDILVPNCNFPIAPRNTWSNLAYIAAGLLVFIFNTNAVSATMGAALIYLGVGSALYHGTKRGWAARLDHAGMYAVFTSLMFSRTYNGPIPLPALMLIASAIVVWLTRNDKGSLTLYTAMGIGVFFSEMAAYLQDGLPTVVWSMSLFLAAMGIWLLDKYRKFWWPKWGHALWHVLTAAAITILYLGVK